MIRDRFSIQDSPVLHTMIGDNVATEVFLVGRRTNVVTTIEEGPRAPVQGYVPVADQFGISNASIQLLDCG